MICCKAERGFGSSTELLTVLGVCPRPVSYSQVSILANKYCKYSEMEEAIEAPPG